MLTSQYTLPVDVARCPGYETDEGDLREGCEDCRRRTDRSTFPLLAWIAPPPLVVFECEARIAPNAELRGRPARGGPSPTHCWASGPEAKGNKHGQVD